MTVETTVSRTVSSKPQREAEAELAKMRRMPRAWWDPEYYADPRNANLARSIMSPIDGVPGMLTEAQFYRAHIAAQAEMYGEPMVKALTGVINSSATVSPGLATGMAQIMQSMSLPQTVIDDMLTLDAEVRAADMNTGGRNPDTGSESEKGWLSNTLASVLRPTFALASLPFEAVIGGIRSIVADISTRDPQFDLSFDLGRKAETETGALEQTLGGQFIEGLFKEDVTADLGEGYIPRGDVHARQVAVTRSAAPLVFNHAWTIGRGIGSLFFDDGDNLMYRNLSGVLDLTANVVLDPFVLVGKPSATVRALRSDIAEQFRRELGLATEGAVLERELAGVAEYAERLAQATEVVSRRTLDTANEVAKEMGRLYGEASRTTIAMPDPQRIASLRARKDMLADAEDAARITTKPSVERAGEQMAAFREREQMLRESPELTETERAQALAEHGEGLAFREAQARAAGPSAATEQDMSTAIDELTNTLGPDGLDAMTAKITGDVPEELPGVFTDAVPMVNRSRALPAAEDGRDAVVRFNEELGPRVLASVDDPVIDPAPIITALKRATKGRSNDRVRATNEMIAMLGRPEVTYAQVIEHAMEYNIGAVLHQALQKTDLDGITDIFRLTSGEGGVWWMTPEVTVAHWTPDGWRMKDTTPEGVKESREALAAQRKTAELELREEEKLQVQARRFSETLTDNYVKVADARTSVADSYEAVRNSLEWGFGVRHTTGSGAKVSYEEVRNALFNPANSFDAAIMARGEIPGGLLAAEAANRGMVALTTLGASEVVRAANRFGIQPFLARSRQRVLDEMVELSDSPESLGRLQRLTGGKLDPGLMQAIMRADTEEKVLEVLGPALGVGITQPIGPGVLTAQRLRLNSINSGRAVGVVFEKGIRFVERMTSITPRLGAYVNLADPQGSATTLRNYMTNLPVVSVGTIDKAVGDFLMQTTEVGRGQAVRRAMNTVADELSTWHASQHRLLGRQPWDEKTVELLNDAVKTSTRVHEGGRAKVNDWWLGKYASDSSIGYMTIDGQIVHLTGPQLESELARGGMVLPHVGELRDAMGRWGVAIQAVPGLRGARDLIDKGMDYWRSSVLFRYAYTLRNIGEMQFRMWLSGHRAVFNDPLGALSMASAMNRRTRTSRGFFAQFSRYNKTATGKELGPPDDSMLEATDEALAEYVGIMTRTTSHHDMRTMRAMEAHHDVREVGVEQPGFTVGWAEELIKLNHSVLARIVAGYTPKQVRDTMKKGADRESAIVDWLLTSQTSKTIRDDYIQAGDSYAKIFTDPQAMRQFLFDSPASVRSRLMEYTANGNEDLVRFVAYGELGRDGEAVFNMSTRHADPRIRELKMQRRANDLAKELTPFKQSLGVDRLRMRVYKSRKTPKGVVDRVFDGFFAWNARKENAWAMGPEFSYAFNDSVAGLMRAMNPQARQEAFDFIRKAETRYRPHSEVNIRAREAMKAPPGSLTMADVEKVAARQAEEHVKKLFYDARTRNQFFHQLRLVMPFAQPFADTLWHWGRLMAERPYMIEKFGRFTTGLSESGSGVIYDDFDAIDPLSDRQSRDPTQGFIYTDPLSGEEMFSFPLIGSALGAVFSPFSGVNAEMAQFKAPVSGLNLAFQGDIDFLPSLGPLVSIPIAVLMPDDAFGAIPEFVRDFAFPFGEPQLEGGLVESVFLPSWGRRLFGALWNDSFRAYSYKGLLAYYASTGEYPGLANNPQMQEKLIDDVQGSAKWLTLIRAAGAALLPAAPSQEIYAADKDGSLIGVTYLSDHWNHIQRESGNDFEKSVQVFIDTYGEQALAAIVPATEGEVSMSGAAWEFHKKHASEAEAYSEIIGAFFPGDYSFEAAQYLEQRGDRRRLTVSQRTNKLLQFMYGAERSQLEGRSVREEWAIEDLDDAKDDLDRKYAAVSTGFTGEGTAQSRLDQVRVALDTFEDLRETRAGQGAELLFDAYERWSDEADLLYGSGLGSQKAAEQRQYFLDEIDLIAQEYGGTNVREGSVETIAGYFQRLVTPRS